MNQNLKQILFWVCLVLTGSSYAQVQIVNLSTGWNNGLLALNTSDDSWTGTLPNGTSFTPKTCTNGSWQGSSANSRWICPSVNDVAPGTYTYKMSFNIDPRSAVCATLKIDAIGADNVITGIYINDHNYTPTLPSGNNHFDPMIGNLEISVNLADLIVGANVLKVTTSNYPATQTQNPNSITGFNFRGKIEVVTDFNIHPVITGPTTLCQGNPLTFNGSLAAGSSPSTTYAWKIEESNSAGTPVPGGFYLENWFYGVPNGNYTFPANLNLPCGKYYVVTLTALYESPCFNWANDLHVFYYNCNPTVSAGPDQTICPGECVTIGANSGKGVYYNWSANGSTVGTGGNISVCPEVTTTYTIAATNNFTGCSATDQVVVSVFPNNPDFDIQTHTYADYYTLTATPVVMNANIFPGFGQYWSVEELGANNSTVFNIQNPPVWFPYPASNNFKGFDDYLLNYSGTVNTLPNAPADGRFVYNKLYRITRGTWNDYCDWNAVSYLLQRTKGANGDEIVITETKAPASRPGKVEDPVVNNSWNISPNPSTGIFIVASDSQGTKQTVFEVFDLFGKKVVSKVIEAGTTSLSLDLSGNAKGVYILNITTDGVNKTHKIVVE